MKRIIKTAKKQLLVYIYILCPEKAEAVVYKYMQASASACYSSSTRTQTRTGARTRGAGRSDNAHLSATSPTREAKDTVSSPLTREPREPVAFSRARLRSALPARL